MQALWSINSSSRQTLKAYLSLKALHILVPFKLRIFKTQLSQAVSVTFLSANILFAIFKSIM